MVSCTQTESVRKSEIWSSRLKLIKTKYIYECIHHSKKRNIYTATGSKLEISNSTINATHHKSEKVKHTHEFPEFNTAQDRSIHLFNSMSEAYFNHTLLVHVHRVYKSIRGKNWLNI